MKIMLCGRAKCCPTVETTEYGYEIKDDYSGKVKLTKKEMNLLRKSII